MTDDLDSADHAAANDDAKFHEKTKRGRLKDAINRTKSMLAEARKHTSHADKQPTGTPANNDLDDFLAAGRASNASPAYPSVFSETASAEYLPTRSDRSTPPRPSTSDSKSQPSPKRLQIPRIDVSTSQRFPNAKEIKNNGPVELPCSSTPSAVSPGSSLLLKPEYKSRSQSASSLASPGRRARIRNLSVGFADTPPIIIGEGGDEAEAPTVEISKAKLHRARSASPQVRTIRSAVDVPSGASRHVPGRQDNDNSVDVFNPKPVSRVQTGALQTTSQSATGYDAFVPNPLTRHQTGSLDVNNAAVAHGAPPLPARNKPFLPPDLGKSQKVTLDLTKEFEMSLGLRPSNSVANKSPNAQEPRIFAPKPQRAPPSYDLIEGGGQEQGLDRIIESPITQTPIHDRLPHLPQGQSVQQNPQSFQQAPGQTTQQDGRKPSSIIHELPSPQGNTDSSTVQHPAGQQQVWQSSQTPQPLSSQPLTPAQRKQPHEMPQSVEQRTLLPKEEQLSQSARQQQQVRSSSQAPQSSQAQISHHVPISQQNQQPQVPQSMEQRVFPHTEQQRPHPIHPQQQFQPSIQESQVQSPQHVSASVQNQQHQMPQRIEQQISPRSEELPRQPAYQQQKFPGHVYGQHLELPAEPVHQHAIHEQSEQIYPEFENFLRSSMLQDEDIRPNPKISRFASLHTTAARRTPNSSQERLNFSEQSPTSNTKILSPIDTSGDQNAYRSFAQRSKPNSRPTSLYGSPATGTPHSSSIAPGTPHSSTIRRVSPPGHSEASSSNYSSAVQSPHSAAESMPNRMRFYENINKGNPPAGYI